MITLPERVLADAHKVSGLNCEGLRFDLVVAGNLPLCGV